MFKNQLIQMSSIIKFISSLDNMGSLCSGGFCRWAEYCILLVTEDKTRDY